MCESGDRVPADRPPPCVFVPHSPFAREGIAGNKQALRVGLSQSKTDLGDMAIAEAR